MATPPPPPPTKDGDRSMKRGRQDVDDFVVGWCQAKPNWKHKPFNQIRKGIKHMQSIRWVHDTWPILRDQKENQWNKEANRKEKNQKQRAEAGRMRLSGRSSLTEHFSQRIKARGWNASVTRQTIGRSGRRWR